MLTISRMGAGSELYYERSVAHGLDDYMRGKGEQEGFWCGRGATMLGLDGVVPEGALTRIMEGVHPVTGDTIRDPYSRGTKLMGFDLMFAAPKSVSIVYAIADDQISRTVAECHDEAVRHALAYLEDTACKVGRRAGGELAYHQARGFLAAAWRHRMSRNEDAQLHTHVTAANLAAGADERWTALDHQIMYRAAKTAGMLYQAELRALISERLGLDWRKVTANGQADLAIVPNDLKRAMSSRRTEMQAAEQDPARNLHLGSLKGRQKAALATRARKRYGVDLESWRGRQRERAAAFGFDRAIISQAVRDGLQRGRTVADHGQPDVFGDRLAGDQGLTEKHTTFDRRAILRAVCQHSRQGIRAQDARRQADEYASRPDFIPTRREPRWNEDRWTNTSLLDVEHQLVADAVGRAGTRTNLVDERVLASAADEARLSREQRAALFHVGTSGNGVDVIQARAGVGKTYTVGAIRAAYERDRYPILGVASSTRARDELKVKAGVENSRTLRSVYEALQRGEELPRYCTVFLDEAATANTRETAVLFAAVTRAEGKVIAVGDPVQLSSVQAGGWFPAIRRDIGGPELLENRRQINLDEQRALGALHAGKPELWMSFADDDGRVYVGDDADQRALHAWERATDAGRVEPFMMIARSNELRDQLNQQARGIQRQRGQLGDDHAYGDQTFAVGDLVICREIDRRCRVVNGTRGRVIEVGSWGVTIDVAGSEHRLGAGDYVLKPRERDGGHALEHAYCLTAHGMQGGECEQAFLVAEPWELTKNFSYSALTRGTDRNELYVRDQPSRDPEVEAIMPAERFDPPTREEIIGHVITRMKVRDDEDLGRDQVDELALSRTPYEVDVERHRELDQGRGRGRGGYGLSL